MFRISVEAAKDFLIPLPYTIGLNRANEPVAGPYRMVGAFGK